MPKTKPLPPAKQAPKVVKTLKDGDLTITVYEDYTPEQGRQATSDGGWGRFSGVGKQNTTPRRPTGGDPVG